MANPSDSTFLTANTGYIWADGDIYEIPQTDMVEGAATGASFSGIGVENQPHQLLLNKINYTHGKQVTDNARVAALLALANLLSSGVGNPGWLSIGSADAHHGTIQLLLQWGIVNLLPYVVGVPLSVPLTFKKPYTTAVKWIYSYYIRNAKFPHFPASPSGVTSNQPAVAAITPYGLSNNQLAVQLGVGDIAVTTGSTPRNGVTGIGWIALGY